MGTWGTAILSNDLGADIKQEWKEYLADGWDPAELSEAYLKSAKENGFFDEFDEAYDFWICLAFVQWKTGRLQPRVKAKALEMLEDKNVAKVESERGWEKSDFKQRMVHLANLKEMLNSPQPKARKIRKPFKQDTDLAAGDIISIKLNSGNYIGLEIIDIDERNEERIPIAIFYNYLSKELPSSESILNSDILRFKDSGMGLRKSNFTLAAKNKKHSEPKDRIIILERGRKPSMKKHMPLGLCFWDEIDNLPELWINKYNEEGTGYVTF